MKSLFYFAIQLFLFISGYVCNFMTMSSIKLQTFSMTMGLILQGCAILWFFQTWKSLQKNAAEVEKITHFQKHRLFWLITFLACLYPAIVINRPVAPGLVWPTSLISFIPQFYLLTVLLLNADQNKIPSRNFSFVLGVFFLNLSILFQMIFASALLLSYNILGPIITGPYAKQVADAITVAPLIFAFAGAILLSFGQSFTAKQNRLYFVIHLTIGFSIPSIGATIMMCLLGRNEIMQISFIYVYQLCLFFACLDLSKVSKLLVGNRSKPCAKADFSG